MCDWNRVIGLPKLRAQSEEMLHLDLTRLIASVGIVAHHSIEYFVTPSNRAWLSEKTMGLALFVDLFFVISGFVIAFVYHERALSLTGYRKFLQRRAGRLIPLHWLTLLGSLLVWSAFVLLGYGGKHPPSFRPECIAETIFLLHSFVPCGTGNSFYGVNAFNGVSWSISAEMVMYFAIFPAIALAAVRNRYIPAIAGVIVLLLLAWFDLENNLAPAGSWIDIHPVLRALPSFFLGAALYYNRNSTWWPYLRSQRT
jgi:peptidoglycan/LPS O-acetylase OafA/YrhL